MLADVIYVEAFARTACPLAGLLNGELSKPAYFAVKNVNAKKFRKHSNLTELYEKNGFVFFKRIRE